jgi:hypothetical protein
MLIERHVELFHVLAKAQGVSGIDEFRGESQAVPLSQEQSRRDGWGISCEGVGNKQPIVWVACDAPVGAALYQG